MIGSLRSVSGWGRFSGGSRHEYVGAKAALPLLDALFDLPALRCEDPPPPAPTWRVTRPLPPPRELATTLAILHPRDGATLRALGGKVSLSPRANRDAVRWFLNGRLAMRESMELAPGRHQLLCCDEKGEAVRMRVVVR